MDDADKILDDRALDAMITDINSEYALTGLHIAEWSQRADYGFADVHNGRNRWVARFWAHNVKRADEIASAWIDFMEGK